MRDTLQYCTHCKSYYYMRLQRTKSDSGELIYFFDGECECGYDNEELVGVYFENRLSV